MYILRVDSTAVFDALELQIWTANSGGHLTFVNDFTARYFRRTREELVGEGWQNFLHSADVPSAVSAWTHSVRSGDPYRIEFRLLRAADRRYRWHCASAKAVDIGETITWIGSNVDIDAERRAEEVFKSR